MFLQALYLINLQNSLQLPHVMQVVLPAVIHSLFVASVIDI